MITWAHQNVSKEMKDLAIKIGNKHWSRLFEYPWIFTNGLFYQNQWVLDAAGGESPLQNMLSPLCRYINIDIVPIKNDNKNVLKMQGDIRSLPFLDNSFERVICSSVLEHVVDPIKAVKELWRVLSPGGKLIITLDVASYSRWNHTIDYDIAKEIVGLFNLQLPPEPNDILTRRFDEITPLPEEPKEVLLKVLCFTVDKN